MYKEILLLESECNRQFRIKEIINETLEYVNVYTAETLAQAYKILVEHTIDIFIVNVVLNCENATDTSGMRFVARIREIPKYTLAPIIMISTLEDPDLYAFQELNCLAYLNRFFSTETMKKLLRKASYYRTNRDVESTLFFRKNRILYPIKIKDIVYMARENKITYIHLKDGSVMDIPYVSYTKVMRDADNSKLLMVNRGTIVNKDYVYAVDPTNYYVLLKDKRGMLDIGTTYRKRVVLEFSGHSGIYCRSSRKRTKEND